MTPTTQFESTLKALERDLTVGLIATTPVYSCESDASSDAVLDHMRANGFSQALVKQSDASVGVIRSPTSRSGTTVVEIMEPLHDWMLVSKGSSLRKVVRGLAREDRRFRLVVGDSSIEGIVTRSDLHKLPVRLLAFSMVTHLESLLSEQIRSSYVSDEVWLSELENGRVPEDAPGHVHSALHRCFERGVAQRIRNRAAVNRKRDAEPDLLDMLDFRDKWYLVHCACSPGGTYLSDMAAIQLFVRNAVMHSRDYAQDDHALDDFDRRLGLTERWIAYFSND